jgi:hypothetical protein
VAATVVGLLMSACGRGPSAPAQVPSAPPQQQPPSGNLTLAAAGVTISLAAGPFQADVPGYYTIDVTPAADSQVVMFDLNAGDGTPDVIVDVGTTAGRQTVAHRYTAAGSYTGVATLTVRADGVMAVSASSFHVTVH